MPTKQPPVFTEEEQKQLIEQSRRFAVPERPPEVEDFWGQVRQELAEIEEKRTV